MRTIGSAGNPSTASGVKYRSAANRRCIKTQISEEGGADYAVELQGSLAL